MLLSPTKSLKDAETSLRSAEALAAPPQVTLVLELYCLNGAGARLNITRQWQDNELLIFCYKRHRRLVSNSRINYSLDLLIFY